MITASRATARSAWRANSALVLAGAAGATLSLTYLYSLGVIMPDLEREFGWRRAEISTGPMIIAVTALVLAPLVGSLIDRCGPRRIDLRELTGSLAWHELAKPGTTKNREAALEIKGRYALTWQEFNWIDGKAGLLRYL